MCGEERIARYLDKRGPECFVDPAWRFGVAIYKVVPHVREKADKVGKAQRIMISAKKIEKPFALCVARFWRKD